MQRRCLEPDVITFSAVISACEKGKQPEQAWELFGVEFLVDFDTWESTRAACVASMP